MPSSAAVLSPSMHLSPWGHKSTVRATHRLASLKNGHRITVLRKTWGKVGCLSLCTFADMMISYKTQVWCLQCFLHYIALHLQLFNFKIEKTLVMFAKLLWLAFLKWRWHHAASRCENCHSVTVHLAEFPLISTHLSPQLFHPMVNLQCSPDLRSFLCALYAPVCTEYGRMSLPCRSLCLHAKKDCHKLMDMFGVSWPEEMECGR